MSRTRGKDKSAIGTAMGDAIPPWQARLLANIQADIERRRKLWPLMAQLWSVPYGKRGKTKEREGYFNLIENRIIALGYSIDELDDIFRSELRPVLWKMQVPRDEPDTLFPESWLWLRPWRCISLMRRRRMPVEELEQRILRSVCRHRLLKRGRYFSSRIEFIGIAESRWQVMAFGIELSHEARAKKAGEKKPFIVRTEKLYVDESLASLKAGPRAPLDARQVVILAFAHLPINKNFRHDGPYFVTPVYNALVDLSVTASQFEQIWRADIKGKMEDFAILLSPGPRPLSAGALLDAAEAHIANHKAGRVPASDRKLNPMRTKPLFRLLYSLLEAREYCFGHINGDRFLADRVGFSDTLARRRQAWEPFFYMFRAVPYYRPSQEFDHKATAETLFQLGYSRAEIVQMKRWEMEPVMYQQEFVSEGASRDAKYEVYEPYIIRSVRRLRRYKFPLTWNKPAALAFNHWHALLNHFDKLSKAAKTDKK